MRLLCNLQALLYDIISVLITKKLKIFILVQHQFLDNFSILISWIVFKTLLYYIWTELLLRQIYEITNKLFSNSLIDLRNLKIQNKLYNYKWQILKIIQIRHWLGSKFQKMKVVVKIYEISQSILLDPKSLSNLILTPKDYILVTVLLQSEHTV